MVRTIPKQFKHKKKLGEGKQVKTKKSASLNAVKKKKIDAKKRPKSDKSREANPFNDLGIGSPIFDEGEDFSEDDKDFIEKTRRGVSFPINYKPIDKEEDASESGDHKKSLDHLIENDPDFYKYLEENEKELLDFEDDEEDEEEDDDGEEQKITCARIEKWSKELEKTSKNIKVIREVVYAFKSSIDQLTDDSKINQDKDEGGKKLRQKLEPELFEQLIKCCIVDLCPAFYHVLGLPSPKGETASKKIVPSKCGGWKKLEQPLKVYLLTLIKSMQVITDQSMVCSLMRHSLHMIPFIGCHHLTIRKKFLFKTIEFWSESREKIRILAFLAIFRLMNFLEDRIMLSYVLKKLYHSYGKNTKVTTIETWPFIIFMRQSLVELYSLDQSMAYEQAFVSIRQAAITLRNAMTGTNDKAPLKAVYNWPFIHSLLLWQNLLSSLHPSEVLKPLIYPLVQVMIGIMKLTPILQYFPTRNHMIRSLIQLSTGTETFIPIFQMIISVS